MGFNSRTTEDLIRIAAAGGGFRLKANTRLIEDLIRIASAACNGGARVFFGNMSSRPTDDLVRISAAGKGAIIFED